MGLIPDMAVRGFGQGSAFAGAGWWLLEFKQVHVSTNSGSHYQSGGHVGELLRKGVDQRAKAVPAEYKRKADAADRKYCGVPAGGGPGPVRQVLDSLREVVPLVFGSLGESSETVRELAKAAAEEAVKSRACRADFNLRSGNLERAAGAISWFLLRRWGRLAILRGLYLKEEALRAVVGSHQAEEREARSSSGVGGVGDEYWFQRASRQDSSGATFMGFGAGQGLFAGG